MYLYKKEEPDAMSGSSCYVECGWLLEHHLAYFAAADAHENTV